MLKKALIIICDGLGDRPIKKLQNRTPLEAANSPNLDNLAAQSECGMMHTLGREFVPGSDVAHLAIMGYNPISKYYSGRGTIEVAGIGMELRKGDVALRGNFGTVEEGSLIIKDRRAGRIRVVEPLTKELDGIEIGNVKFLVKPGTAHRAGIIMRGEGLSNDIIDSDPHENNIPVRTVTPTDNTPEASHTAEILNQFLEKAHNILKNHQFNKERIRKNKNEANYLLVRGAGQYKEVPTFKERFDLSACCIAGGGLYKGIGAFLGMDVINVPGATGLPDTDIQAKFTMAINTLEKYNFVFVHVKAADSLGEDGDYVGKTDFIEKIDQAMISFNKLPDETLIIVTADHSTPSELRHHSGDPVPIMFSGQGVRVDKTCAFNERACADGGLGFIEGKDVIPHIRNLLDILPFKGA